MTGFGNSRRSERRLVLILVCLAGLAGCRAGDPLSVLDAPAGPDHAPRQSGSLVEIADRTLASGDGDAALDLYRRAARESDRPDALLRLGQVLFARGQFDYAAGAFKEVLLRQPDNAVALRGLGVSQLAQGQVQDSGKTIETAVRAHDDVRSVRDLAVLRIFQGEGEEARLVFFKALGLWPEDLALRSNYALFEALANNCDQAVKVGRDAATSPFAHPQQGGAFALTLAVCGRDAEATEAARRVMSDKGSDALLALAAQIRKADGLAARAVIAGVVPASDTGVMAPAVRPVDAARPH